MWLFWWSYEEKLWNCKCVKIVKNFTAIKNGIMGLNVMRIWKCVTTDFSTNNPNDFTSSICILYFIL